MMWSSTAVVQLAVNQLVIGSIPISTAIIYGVSSVVAARLSVKQ